MTGHIGKATRRSKSDGVGVAAQSERRDSHSRLPGQIVAFDSATQTATVKIMFKPTVNGEVIEPPLLEGVPVNQPRGGGFAITQPIQVGDPVDLSFDDVDTSGYYESGEQSGAVTQRMNSLSDAVATPGRYPKGKAMGAYDPDNFFIGSDDHKNGMRVSPDGKIAIEGSAGGEDLVTILFDLLGVLLAETTSVGYGSSAGPHPLTNQAQYAAIQARLAKMKLR